MRSVTYMDGGAPHRAVIAPVTGADEAALDAGGQAPASVELLRRLARDPQGRPLAVERLSVSDTDRMLAAVYDDLYGDDVDCRVACRACGEPYQFALSLKAV